MAEKLAYFSLVLTSFVHSWAQDNLHVLERVFICTYDFAFMFTVHILGRPGLKDGLWIPMPTLPEKLQHLSVLNKYSMYFLVSHLLTLNVSL